MSDIQRYEVQGYGVQDIREDESGEFVRWDDVKHLIGSQPKRKTTQPPTAGVDVSEEMERGRIAFDEAREAGSHERDALDAALHAALRTGGGAS